MTQLLVATYAGCRVFDADSECPTEMVGRQIGALAHDEKGGCFAVVDDNEIWRRSAAAEWSLVATTHHRWASLVSVDGSIFGGSTSEAALFRMTAHGITERLEGFDETPGRSTWFAQGPPLHVRALTWLASGGAIIAAVHVGGIPRSVDGGDTWHPTLPIDDDVHEVRAHASLPIVAAAAAVGLCVSTDGGLEYRKILDGLDAAPSTESLAVAFRGDEALFSLQEGGAFAKRSQIWRWRVGEERVSQVRDGLPEYLTGRVDTSHIAAGIDESAVLDAGGNLWLSTGGSTDWRLVSTDVEYASGLLFVDSR